MHVSVLSETFKGATFTSTAISVTNMCHAVAGKKCHQLLAGRECHHTHLYTMAFPVSLILLWDLSQMRRVSCYLYSCLAPKITHSQFYMVALFSEDSHCLLFSVETPESKPMLLCVLGGNEGWVRAARVVVCRHRQGSACAGGCSVAHCLLPLSLLLILRPFEGGGFVLFSIFVPISSCEVQNSAALL